MRNLIILLILSVIASNAAVAATKKKPAKKAANLSTDIRFSGHEVGGKYQIPGEAITTVENEKSLIEMIEPRREFKDRLRKSVTQR